MMTYVAFALEKPRMEITQSGNEYADVVCQQCVKEYNNDIEAIRGFDKYFREDFATRLKDLYLILIFEGSVKTENGITLSSPIRFVSVKNYIGEPSIFSLTEQGLWSVLCKDIVSSTFDDAIKRVSDDVIKMCGLVRFVDLENTHVVGSCINHLNNYISLLKAFELSPMAKRVEKEKDRLW